MAREISLADFLACREVRHGLFGHSAASSLRANFRCGQPCFRLMPKCLSERRLALAMAGTSSLAVLCLWQHLQTGIPI